MRVQSYIIGYWEVKGVYHKGRRGWVLVQKNEPMHEIWEFSEYRLLSVYIEGERKHGHIYRISERPPRLEVEANPELDLVETYRIDKRNNCRMWLYGIESGHEYYRLSFQRRDAPPRQPMIGRIREAVQVAWLIITGKHNR